MGLAIVEGEKEPSAGKDRIQTLLRFANENAETGIDLFYDDLGKLLKASLSSLSLSLCVCVCVCVTLCLPVERLCVLSLFHD